MRTSYLLVPGRNIKINFVLLSAFLLLHACVNQVAAQHNLGFEKGLEGWYVMGNAKNIIADTVNAKSGRTCVRIGSGYGGLFQKRPVKALSILYYNVYIRSDSSGIKGYSFIRFYNIHNRLLLEYKSKPVASAEYEKSGVYTEVPPLAKYITFGVETDSSGKGFIYADDFELELNVGEPVNRHKPQCNIDQYMRPFWKSDTIYNETVLLYSEKGFPAKGKLLFQPDHIISINSFNGEKKFTAAKDYILNGKTIEKRARSLMPFRGDTSFDTRNDLAWYNIASQWIVVTYTHHDKWTQTLPVYRGEDLPRTMTKLTTGKPLNIIAFGMSITRGMDVSGYDTVPPYMPTYISLFAGGLEKIYHNKINLYNAGLPGSTISWAAQYADEYVSALKPDLVILDFGMNDFWNTPPSQFRDLMDTVIHKISRKNRQAEFLLISNLQYDPDYILKSDSNKETYDANMHGYRIVLENMQQKGIINLDMNSLSESLYELKKAKDFLANPLHPNDYMARWYAQCLVQLFSR